MIFRCFLFLCFFCHSTVEEDLRTLKSQYKEIYDNYDIFIVSIKNNQTQIDHITKENTELRKDIRALNQDIHALQNKKTETSTLSKIRTISIIIVCFAIAFVLLRFYYQSFQ